MTLGALVLGLGVAAGAAGLFPLPGDWRAHARRLHLSALLAALVLLATDLLTGNLQYAYAWAHGRVDDPVAYRLAGVWGGEEGTILLWTSVLALAAHLVSRKAQPLDRAASTLLFGASTTLAASALALGTFDPTSAAQFATSPSGRGLADILLTPLMVIHPPTQFVAYGLIAVPAAYALAALWRGEDHNGAWAARALPWARVAWLVATLGLGLGALWAYYVLSFGGYWAWDPVETGNLLPWLALTAFLHAGKARMRSQGSANASLVLAYGAMLLTLFATFSTRSGLWVSVHAFTDPTDRFEPDAAARLVAILDVHAPTRMFVALLLGALFAGAALFALRRLPRAQGVPYTILLATLAGGALLAPHDLVSALAWLATRVTPLGIGLGILFAGLVGVPVALAYARAEGDHARLDLSPRTMLTASVALLGVSLGVALLLDIQVVNGPERSVFDARAPFLALPIASVMTLMLARAPFGTRGALALAGTALAAGLVGATLSDASRVYALALPVCGAAALAAVARIIHTHGKSAPIAERVAGGALLIAGLLALLMWSNPPTALLGQSVPDWVSVGMALGGMTLGILAILGASAALRGTGRRLALGGALCATIAGGYLVGALLGILAGVLLLRARSTGRYWPAQAPRLRETGIWIVHLAVVLGLLGYAASTYAQEREVFTGAPLDATLAVGDLDVALSSPSGDVTEGRLDLLSVPLHLSRAGTSVGDETLLFEWQARSRIYSGELAVRRGLMEDIYVNPLAFHTPDGWVGADSATGERATAAGVDAVTFSVAVLPLMSLVWGGTWMMIIGMGLILAGAWGTRNRKQA